MLAWYAKSMNEPIRCLPRDPDPWACIPNPDTDYAGTELELPPSTATEPEKG